MIEVLRLADFPDAIDETGEGLLRPDANPFCAWVPSRCIAVLGNSQTPEGELHCHNILQDKIPVFRRIGGGGAVILHSSQCCYAVRFPRRRDWGIADYFRLGSDFLKSACQKHLGIRLEARGISDLCLGEQKVLGCSLYLPRHCALYLASVLVDDSLPLMQRYLRHPSREPLYRQGREHASFVTHLNKYAPELRPATLATWLKEQAQQNPHLTHLPQSP